MKHRKLRIAWSVGSGIALLLLIVMWVRSYGREGILFRHIKRIQFTVQSSDGRLRVLYYRPEYSFDAATNLYKLRNGYLIEKLPQWLVSRGLSLNISSGVYEVCLPYKYLVPFLAIVALIPFIPQPSPHFSLRTLLIATTLAPVGLGLIVWASK